MEHLIVSFSILAFGSGIAAIMYVRGLYKRYLLPYLKIFWQYLIVLNIAVFLNMTLHYMLANVLTFSNSKIKIIIIFIVNLVGFFLSSIFTFLFISLTRNVIGKELSSIIKKIFYILIVCVSMSYGFAIAKYFYSNQAAVFVIIHKIAISIITMISLMASVQLYSGTYQMSEKIGIRTLRIFSIVYFVVYLFQIISFFTSFQFMLLFSTIILFVLNVIPVMFLASYLNEQKKRFILNPEAKGTIENFYIKSGLSKREKQIADFIIAGKSNIQIKDELFISLSTVKKHISNIFLKLNVNSRTQLIHFILKEANWNSSDTDKEHRN